MKNNLLLIFFKGWGWLGFNKGANKLQIAACANQDPLEATTGISYIKYKHKIHSGLEN